MIHYDRAMLVDDNMLLVETDCDTCYRGSPTDACTCVNGFDVQLYDLTTLLRNLAIAGALCEAWKQLWYTWTLACRHWDPGCGRPWSRGS